MADDPKAQSSEPQDTMRVLGRSGTAAAKAGAETTAKAAQQAESMIQGGAELASDRIQSLLASYSAIAGGWQEVQRTYIETLQHSIDMAMTGPRELARCSSFSEVAEVQRELLRRAMDEWVDSGTKMLRATSRLTEEAIRPIGRTLERAA